MKMKVTKSELKECVANAFNRLMTESSKTKKIGSKKGMYDDMFKKEAESRREGQKNNGGLNFKSKPKWKSKEEKQVK